MPPPRPSVPPIRIDDRGDYFILRHDADRPVDTILISAHGLARRMSNGRRLDDVLVPAGMVLHFYNPRETKLQVQRASGPRRVMTDMQGVILEEFQPYESTTIETPRYVLASYEATSGPNHTPDGIVQTLIEAWQTGKAPKDVLMLKEDVRLDFLKIVSEVRALGYVHVHCLFCRGSTSSAPSYNVENLRRERPPKPPRVTGKGIADAWMALGARR